jgi:hypothetical protein
MKKNVNVLLFAGMFLMSGLFFSCEVEEDPVETGTVTGIIINSQTGYGLEYVMVGLSSNGSIQSIDDAEFSAITDAYGNYSIEDVPVGTYVCIINANGYFERIVTNIVVSEGENELNPQTIVQQPEAGSFRIILTWGADPLDLDSHLTGPASDGVNRFHLSYLDQTPDVNVDLDVDDIESYGPETTTIHSFMNGTYRFSVHNYSNQLETGGAEIPVSPAIVEVYDFDGLVSSFTAPSFTGYGNSWRVFEINASGSSISVIPVNTYIMASNSDDMASF